MPASPQTAHTDPTGIDLAQIAGHLAAICDRAVARLERGVDDEIDLGLVIQDLRDVRDLLIATEEGTPA